MADKSWYEWRNHPTDRTKALRSAIGTRPTQPFAAGRPIDNLSSLRRSWFGELEAMYSDMHPAKWMWKISAETRGTHHPTWW